MHKLPIPRVPVLVTQEDLEGYTFEDGEDVREAGERLAASYVNYYCANGAIVLPAFGGENAASDAQAAAILAGLFPGRRIISVYAREILTGGRQHSLHHAADPGRSEIMRNITVAAIQMRCVPDPAENLRTAERLVRQAARAGCAGRPAAGAV